MAKVKVTFHPKGKKARTAIFNKPGTKESLCAVRKITIKGKSFMGRRGGRTLCGPSTGKNTAAARAARAAFKRMVKGAKRRVVRRRRRSRR